MVRILGGVTKVGTISGPIIVIVVTADVIGRIRRLFDAKVFDKVTGAAGSVAGADIVPE